MQTPGDRRQGLWLSLSYVLCKPRWQIPIQATITTNHIPNSCHPVSPLPFPSWLMVYTYTPHYQEHQHEGKCEVLGFKIQFMLLCVSPSESYAATMGHSMSSPPADFHQDHHYYYPSQVPLSPHVAPRHTSS